MSISLPIPEIKLLEKDFFWVPFDTSKKCTKYSFTMKTHEPIKNLRKFVGRYFNVNNE